ncbi:hypothetical protein JH06_4619 [Blastocystis sp. subtype 4]|uniref:hypothetical protein n=1 Tax=Blastocystis sp. subtype 4 TaxID=944170 RepID=UPI000711FBCB|nr:hypothetical protein JH06_4619 [Blastocystis sp. subtype 4]KNB41914.1 hypothetical protein JH06_4619 [Blastocystis sp. subtype 4]|eukprot:XP_014525357.1 hypothetical protein JH06_4619 [Blastocystis sp. subtype 4]
MDSAEIEGEVIESTGVLSDFYTPDDFLMAFSVANSLNRIGEDYSDTLSSQCLQALRFLNVYASKINVDKEDVVSLLNEFGLPSEMIPRVIDRVIALAHDYHSLIDTFVQSLSSYSLIDFDWSLRVTFLYHFECR